MRSMRSSFSIKGRWDYLFNRQVMNYFLIRHGDKSRHFKDIERQEAISEEQKLKSCWSLITTWLKPVTPWRGYFCPLLFSLFSTLPIRREVTEFFYHCKGRVRSNLRHVVISQRDWSNNVKASSQHGTTVGQTWLHPFENIQRVAEKLWMLQSWQ